MRDDIPETLWIIEGLYANVVKKEALFDYKGKLIDCAYPYEKTIWQQPNFAEFMGNFNIIVRRRKSGFNELEMKQIEEFTRNT